MEHKRMPIFAERFHVLRGDMTQGEFADFLEISRPTVGFYENGQRIPDALVLRQIAEKCRASVDWLLGVSNVRSPIMEVQTVCKYTGLSEEVVEQLDDWKRWSQTGAAEMLPLVNQILASGSFCMMLYHIRDFKESIIAENVYWKMRREYFPANETPLLEEDNERQKQAFSISINRLSEEAVYSNGIIDKILTEHRIWNGDDSSKSLKNALLDVDGFSLSDVSEYRISKDLSDLIVELRSEGKML